MDYWILSRLKNKKLHFQLSKKIPGVKQEYKSLTSIIDKITWLPKTVNLYLIKKDIPNNKHHTEFIAELRAKLLAKVKRKIEINAQFVCEVEWELDEDAFDSICWEKFNHSKKKSEKVRKKIRKSFLKQLEKVF